MCVWIVSACVWCDPEPCDVNGELYLPMDYVRNAEGIKGMKIKKKKIFYAYQKVSSSTLKHHVQ